METSSLSEAEWKSRLTPEQYYVLRLKGTEKPFSGKYVNNTDHGTYRCSGCGEALFSDDMKFDSHSGWPSFDGELRGGKIKKTMDHSHGMLRSEITCVRCGGHLGHLFDDGPTATGMKYCVHPAALTFEPVQNNASAGFATHEVITLGGSCFWCIEAVFAEITGVIEVVSGYSGGHVANPSYRQVTSGPTGYAEVVQVKYDPNEISYEEILEVFFTVHDPTTLNRQGADTGTQYRSAIFYHNERQKVVALDIIHQLNSKYVFENPVLTEVVAFNEFYRAEDHHQQYYALNRDLPYCKAVIRPKLDKLQQAFSQKFESNERQ